MTKKLITEFATRMWGILEGPQMKRLQNALAVCRWQAKVTAAEGYDGSRLSLSGCVGIC